jgi:alpha-galactosidase
MLTPGLENADFRLLDVNPQAAEEVAAACRATAKSWDLPATFLPTADEARGLDGADFVIITISTGGLDAMQHDVHLPEKYGIFATVGDTVGPGGWSRGLRNIPVFMRIAEQTRKYCPRAPILNYTNPMTTLTKTLCLSTSAPVIGLCHGLFECYRTLMSIFGLESEDDIRANFAGVNHFFWILDFAVRGQDGYAMLARKTAKKRFAELVKEVYVDGAGFHSDKWVASELYEQYGKLPYVGDRHTCEFFSRYLAPDEGKLTQYRIRRTMVKERRTGKRRGRAWVRSLACGKAQLQRKRSRETAADIISAMSQNKQFVDVMNVPNRGQVSNLPLGSVVETLGVVNALGFTPLAAGALPRDILGVVMPHVTNQDWIVEAGMTGDWDKAFAALIQDPLCSHLSIPQVKKMGRELLEKNRRWLPQFFGRSATRKA